MARATKIYVVTGSDRVPMAAFTVKHECKTWLKNRLELGGYRGQYNFEEKCWEIIDTPEPIWVASYPDNGYTATVPVWDIKSFLESR